jgi:hypothetical protein
MFSTKSKQSSRPWSPITTELKLDAYDIRKYRANDIADELTLINQTLLLSIKPEELCNFAFLSTKKVQLIFLINQLFKFFFSHRKL